MWEFGFTVAEGKPRPEAFKVFLTPGLEEGHLLVSEPLYGYKYIPKRDNVHGYYEINEDEACVVRMMFDWIDKEGLTLRKIVQRLHELGIKPRRSKRGVWNTSTLSHLFKNRGYVGEARWGSSYAVQPEKPLNIERYKKIKKTSRRVKPQEEWHIIPVPAIVDREVFIRVGERLTANFLLSQVNTKNQYLLAGRIRCVCGRNRGGEGLQNGKYLFYRCTDRTASHPLPPKCKEKGINARIADEMVWDRIAALMSSPDLLHKQIQRWNNGQKNKTKSSIGDAELMRKEISKLKNEEDRYNKAYGSDLFSIEQLKEYTKPIRERITALEVQILKVEQQEREMNAAALPDEKDVEIFAQKAVKVLQNLKFEAKKAIVVNVVDKVIGTTQHLQVYGYIPVNINVLPIHRHRRPSKRR